MSKLKAVSRNVPRLLTEVAGYVRAFGGLAMTDFLYIGPIDDTRLLYAGVSLLAKGKDVKKAVRELADEWKGKKPLVESIHSNPSQS